jgi:EAL domain-containing protein (putative c-di-GMP-specific phosphodiesterase class I)
MYPGDGPEPAALMKNAAAALHRAKHQGRNQWAYYRPEMNARATDRVRLEAELRRAVESDALDRHFVLHYQPKVSATTGRYTGFEALMRWMHPERGIIPPTQFIPLLEESGLIVEAGLWAIRRAMSDCSVWWQEGLRPPRIAVNVSSVQLGRAQFVASVRQILSEPGPSPASLDIEITESLIMQNLDAMVSRLTELRDMGVGIAIDDFGTGYSSLAYLASLPVASLKIDRSFVATMTTSARSRSIVSSIISLAHALKLKVVAEGVEQQQQADDLRLLRCDELQGYLFGKPVDAQSVAALLRDRHGARAG